MATKTVISKVATPELDAQDAAIQDQHVTLTFSDGTAENTTYNKIINRLVFPTNQVTILTEEQTAVATLLNIQ